MEQPSEKNHEIHEFDLNSPPAADYPSSQISGDKERSDLDENSSFLTIPDNPSPQKSGEKERSNIDENSSEKPQDHNESCEEHRDSQAQIVDSNSSNYTTRASLQYYDRFGQQYDSFERDTIKVKYNNLEFRVNIVETKPSNAICIIDTDCEVDFALPLDYKEPEQPVLQSTKEETSKEGQKLVPFTGFARRLEEKHAAEGKVVFGSVAHGKKSKELKTEDVKAETPKKEQFQPFTGEKYSLED
ncbi:unnamed protein product [Dovyalis caffra]|uniref:Ubiquitin fusion degradation protein UFD1 N-terminal subdomain 2 domain-containing protein n=1 Tax=Dovyalis caffra TaxID=77055 RepID=A0AAV1RYY6_9ROSI|nr:unnamed protein product [Dovyalis caffra]